MELQKLQFSSTLWHSSKKTNGTQNELHHCAALFAAESCKPDLMDIYIYIYIHIYMCVLHTRSTVEREV